MLLITGITGHTGNYFLKELIVNNYTEPIKCTVRETSDTTLIDKSGLNIVKIKGDLNDSHFIEESINGVETIVHIYNIHHSPLIVEYALKKKVPRIILVHTTGIYSKFKYASQEYKIIEQKIFELKNNSKCQSDITILRPSMIYGDLCDKNMSKFIKLVDKFKIIPIINYGKNLIQPVNARDLGKALYSVLNNAEETANKAYDLTGDRPLQMIEALNIIAETLKKRRVYINIPLELAVFAAKLFKIITLGKVNVTEKVQRMGENRSYSHKEATDDFQYCPMSFEDGIKIEVNEYLKSKEIIKIE